MVIGAAGLDSDGTSEGCVGVATDVTMSPDSGAVVRERDLLLERERIALALQDAIVHRIFEVGLALDSALPLIHNPAATERIAHARTVLQDTLTEIRNVVHDLNTP
jgi:signal transduction histidine kinase